MNLLWVENHPAFTRFARSFLAGYDVTVAPSLTSARDALAQKQFDVVLMDYDLDDGKGNDLVRELVTSSRRPVIIATSAHAEGNAALLAAGADGVCGKLEFHRIASLLRTLTAVADRNDEE